MSRSSLKISGMDCISCAGQIEEKVGKLPGVYSIQVQKANGRAIVEYDEDEIKLETILDAIINWTPTE